MSTHDVPGARAANNDVLAMGCWAEHDDGSMIFVESVEGGTVVYSIFDLSQDPKIEYRDAMPEAVFKDRFSWKPDTDDPDNIQWTWRDKTPMPWERVMENFPPGQRHTSAAGQITAAERVARSLHLQAQRIRQEDRRRPLPQRAANAILAGISAAVGELTK